MSQEEEQPRPSLRLRKTPDRPPESPPAAPAEPAPKAAGPTPVNPAAGAAAPETPVPESASETPKETRPRLSSILKPAEGVSVPAAPPAPPVPEPAAQKPAAKALPPVVEPVVPKSPPVVYPDPRPAPAAQPAAGPPPVDMGLPKIEEPRALHFPQPPEARPEDKPQTKAPSPRTVGLIALAGLLVVAGAIAYLFIADPFGLFKEAAPAASASPSVVTPPPQVQQQPPAAPIESAKPQEAPPKVETPPPAVVEAEPEFKMPAPAPLVGGEEIAPGVVRLPRDASATSLPEARSFEPPAPKPNPAITAVVNNLNISGIRANSSGGFLMIGGSLYHPGDIVDAQSRLEFVSIEGSVISFKDSAGAIYTRRF